MDAPYPRKMTLPCPTSFVPCVWLFGAPASGKTMARRFVSAWLAERGSRAVHLGIDEAQRVLMPPGGEDGTYEYDGRGALILLDRERQIREALRFLFAECEAASRNTGFIGELAHADMPEAISLGSPGLFAGALVLHLQAPLPLRVTRNLARGPDRVPSSVVIGYPQELGPVALSLLRQRGATVRMLSNGSTREALELQLERYLREFFVDIPSLGSLCAAPESRSPGPR